MPTTDRSLEDIEGDFWGEPPADATRLMSTVYALRRRPVGSLEVEALRMLIGQREGLEVLVPLALARLAREPLAEGDFYAGDLLVAVLRLPDEYWRGHGDQARQLREITGSVDPADVDEELQQDIAGFRGDTY